VRLALEGRTLDSTDSIPWLDAIPGVRIARTAQDYAELDVPRDVDPEIVLRTALDRGERVTNFLIADPSIEEIFIERVGRPAAPEEEKHLAGSVAAPDSGVTEARAATPPPGSAT
jgi:hypothetical protein